MSKLAVKNTCAPPGYHLKVAQDDFVSQRVAPKSAVSLDKELMRRQVWDFGKSPFSNIFSTLIMLYFAGNALSIVSLMLCGVMVSGPIKAFLGFSSSFKVFEDSLGRQDAALIKAKVVFILINLAILAVGTWKISMLGILPFTSADVLRSLPIYSTEGLAEFYKASS